MHLDMIYKNRTQTALPALSAGIDNCRRMSESRTSGTKLMALCPGALDSLASVLGQDSERCQAMRTKRQGWTLVKELKDTSIN